MIQKNKILFVAGNFPKLSETFIVNQITGLLDVGFTIEIFANAKSSSTIVHKEIKKYNLLQKTSYDQIQKSSGIVKRYLKFFYLIFKNLENIQWSVFFKAINFLRYGKQALNLDLFYKSIYFIFHKMPEVIHVHFGHNGIRFAELKEIKIIPEKVKIIVTFHGYDLIPNKEEYYRKKYALLFKLVDVYTVNTLYLMNILVAVNPNLLNVVVLPVGPNLKLFNNNEQKVREKNVVFQIVFCGRLIGLKGVQLVLEIAKELKKYYSKFKINIIGDGELKEELILNARKDNIEDVIQFHGGLTQEVIKTIFKESHLFLFPGILDKDTKRAETQGLVIQEAQAMGLPVLISDVGGMKYGMIDNETGFVIPQNDINSFVNKIIFFIDNESERLKIGENAIKYVNENFNQQLLTKKLIKEVYKI
jgi:colanic acid/amylovoran biosynthesis glycosyltransferase